MKLVNNFKDFLENEVNLNATRLSRLNASVNAVTNFLRGSDMFATYFGDTISQGSYAHRTIIRPVQDYEDFDADILFFLDEVSGWEAKDYVQNLYTCLRGSPVYRDKVSRKTRCVTVNYAGDFHIDVVPFLARHEKRYVTNRHENNYEETNPEGYNDWLEEKHRTSNYHLVKVIRLVKYLRNYKKSFDVKSVVLNVLLGGRVNDAALLAEPNCYADVPTTLRTVMNRLSEYVHVNVIMPTILDPSGTGENFGDRWDQDKYSNFRAQIIRYAEWIDDAYLEQDKPESVRKWRKIFGDAFPEEPAAQKSSGLVKSAFFPPASYRDTEEDLSDHGIAVAIQPEYKVRITGRVMRKHGFRDYKLSSSGSKVQIGRRMEFQITQCDVPEPVRIYWKIKNNGDEARRNDCIRGQIESRGNVRAIQEPTAFAGPHYVECYVVKNGVCVAKDRQEVIITENR